MDANRKFIRKFDKDSSLVIKGIAILLMMLHHNFRDVSLFENYTISFFPFPQAWVVGVADMSKICVSLFAFVSGYGLFLSCKNNKIGNNKWVICRYIKTFSGYWIVWILSAIICQIINGRFVYVFLKTDIWNALINIIIDFLGLHNLFGTYSLNGTWWYMSAAFVFILISPMLVKFQNNLWLILVGVVAFPRIICGDSAFTGDTSIYAFLTPFIFGVIFARYNYIERIVNRNNNKLRFIIEVLLLLIAYKVYRNLSIRSYWELKWGLIPLLVIVFSIEYIAYISKIRGVLIFLGKHSMNIFLVHTFIRAYYLADFTYSWSHFILINLVLLLISLLISLIVERSKRIIKYDDLIENLCAKIINL